jgi:hypothetical protein
MQYGFNSPQFNPASSDTVTDEALLNKGHKGTVAPDYITPKVIWLYRP